MSGRTVGSMTTVVAALAWLLPGAASGQAPIAPAVTQQEPRGLSLIPGINVPLEGGTAAPADGQTQGEQVVGTTRIQLTVRYAPADTWFARVTGYYYVDGDQKRPWHPDFTYSFGYDDWRPGTFALTYDNYNGNRLSPDDAAGEHVTRFEEGTITGSYKLPIPAGLEALFPADGEARWSSAVALHLTPRFQRAGETERGDWKTSTSFGVRNRFYKGFYVEGRFFYYPDQAQQQPWDPDFTYGFGYFDWRPGTLSVQYGNYAGNRFFGRDRPGSGSFRSGSITATFITAW